MGRRTTHEGDSRLTPREIEIVRLTSEGLTAQEIAERLARSRRTVEAHRWNISKKLGIGDRASLVRWAIRRGLIEP